MKNAASPLGRRMNIVTKIRNSYLAKFLIVGGLSFAIDIGLLILLHEFFGVGLWIATPVAFLTSLVFNFALQRTFTFKATNKGHVSAIRYAILVVFNTLATDVIVNMFATLALTYAGGKVVATVSTMVWNFFLYKYWIFPHSDSGASPATTDSELTPSPEAP